MENSSDQPNPQMVFDLWTETWVQQEVFTITRIEVFPRSAPDEPDLFVCYTQEGAEILCGEARIPIFLAEVIVNYPKDSGKKDRYYTGPIAYEFFRRYAQLYAEFQKEACIKS